MKTKFTLECYYDCESNITKIVLLNYSSFPRARFTAYNHEIILFEILGNQLNLGAEYASKLCQLLADRLMQLAETWSDADLDKNIEIFEQSASHFPQTGLFTSIESSGGSISTCLMYLCNRLVTPKRGKSYVCVSVAGKGPVYPDDPDDLLRLDFFELGKFDITIGMPVCLNNLSMGMSDAARVWDLNIQKHKQKNKAPALEFLGTAISRTTYTKDIESCRFEIGHKDFNDSYFCFEHVIEKLIEGYILEKGDDAWRDPNYSGDSDSDFETSGLENKKLLSAKDINFITMLTRDYGSRDEDKCDDQRSAIDFTTLAKKLGWSKVNVQYISDVRRISYSYVYN